MNNVSGEVEGRAEEVEVHMQTYPEMERPHGN
jgi:hypothetical protein